MYYSPCLRDSPPPRRVPTIHGCTSRTQVILKKRPLILYRCIRGILNNTVPMQRYTSQYCNFSLLSILLWISLSYVSCESPSIAHAVAG